MLDTMATPHAAPTKGKGYLATMTFTEWFNEALEQRGEMGARGFEVKKLLDPTLRTITRKRILAEALAYSRVVVNVQGEVSFK